MKKVHFYVRHTILKWIDFFYTPFKKYIPLHTFRYLACGGTNTMFDICLFSFSYNFILKKNDLHLGVFTLPSGFYLNRYVVFQQTGLKRRAQLMRFVTVTAVCIFLNYIFLKLFFNYLGFYATPAKIITTLLVVVFSYSIQTYVFYRAADNKVV